MQYIQHFYDYNFFQKIDNFKKKCLLQLIHTTNIF